MIYTLIHQTIPLSICKRSEMACGTLILYIEFVVMNNNLKLKYLMIETLVKGTSEYIYCCYCKWRDLIYK